MVAAVWFTGFDELILTWLTHRRGYWLRPAAVGSFFPRCASKSLELIVKLLHALHAVRRVVRDPASVEIQDRKALVCHRFLLTVFLLENSPIRIAVGVWLAACNILEYVADTLGACQVCGPRRSFPAALSLPAPSTIVRGSQSGGSKRSIRVE